MARGALHEDTAYGVVRDDRDLKIGNLVYRKALTALTPNDIDRVRNDELRKKLVAVREEALEPLERVVLRSTDESVAHCRSPRVPGR